MGLIATPTRALVTLSLVLLVVRAYAATRVGFGDAEALYAAYALHPQPSYLDHPGLVGSLARVLGHGGAPSPPVAHAATSILATLVPWIATLAARAAGAERSRAPIAGLALVAAPEITVGLFGLTPDLILAPLWLATLGAFALALRAPGGSITSLFAFLVAGGAAGLAADGKVSALLLFPAMAAALPARHLRSWGPWLGLALGALLFLPVVVFEARAGYPMLQHRLVATQGAAGVSFRNAAALVGGQLGYLSPIVAVGAALSLRRALGLRLSTPGNDVPRFLRLAAVVPLVPLVLACLWSRVAEPHWLAPALLALPLLLARGDVFLPPRIVRWALPSGLALSALAHGWALTELAPRWLGRAYEARYDLANDLYATPALAAAVSAARARALERAYVPPVIVAVHWTIAAQLASALGDVPITTRGEESDDFRRWLPRTQWERRPAIVWVTDDRFDAAPPPAWSMVEETTVALVRGGRVVRRARVAILVQSAGG